LRWPSHLMWRSSHWRWTSRRWASHRGRATGKRPPHVMWWRWWPVGRWATRCLAIGGRWTTFLIKRSWLEVELQLQERGTSKL
jgi:hypothetical protein